MSRIPTDLNSKGHEMTTIADKIRALPIYDYLSAEAAYGFACAREAAAALVEAEPLQAVRAKPDWDYFQGLVNIARRSAEKAKIKFPQPNYVTLKIAEEAGEVVRGAVHYAEGRMEWDEVQGEIVQLLAMLIRFVTEGDEVNGIKPPDLVTRTPPPVDASPAPDPVSKTPTLDAMVAAERERCAQLANDQAQIFRDEAHDQMQLGHREMHKRAKMIASFFDAHASAIRKGETP